MKHTGSGMKIQQKEQSKEEHLFQGRIQKAFEQENQDKANCVEPFFPSTHPEEIRNQIVRG